MPASKHLAKQASISRELAKTLAAWKDLPLKSYIKAFHHPNPKVRSIANFGTGKLLGLIETLSGAPYNSGYYYDNGLSDLRSILNQYTERKRTNVNKAVEKLLDQVARKKAMSKNAAFTLAIKQVKNAQGFNPIGIRLKKLKPMSMLTPKSVVTPKM